jgi:hypothetical protein
MNIPVSKLAVWAIAPVQIDNDKKPGLAPKRLKSSGLQPFHIREKP